MALRNRPDMRAYFSAIIDRHVNGMLASSVARLPHGVSRVNGDVTDSVITVTMQNGEVFTWAGGRYAARKVKGCYAPLMPRPVV